jgi:hypothetical protein
MNIPNWKTILAGSLYPLAKMLENIKGGPVWIYYIGQTLEIVAVFGLGIVAKDYNVTGGDTKNK